GRGHARHTSPAPGARRIAVVPERSSKPDSKSCPTSGPRRPELDRDRDLFRKKAGGAVIARLFLERRLLVGARCRHLGDWAAGMETAAGGPVCRGSGLFRE